MDRSTCRALVASAAAAALVATAPMPHALAEPRTPRTACTTLTCVTAGVRHDIATLARRAVRIRDLRGLTDAVVLAPVIRSGDLATLVAERVDLRAEIDGLQHTRPIWRTLRRWRDWMCIHVREGAWNGVDGAYHGGLQMDTSFQRAYGHDMLRRYGTSDHWPVAAQVLVAERAHAVRGFTPWPRTARACGLL